MYYESVQLEENRAGSLSIWGLFLGTTFQERLLGISHCRALCKISNMSVALIKVGVSRDYGK